MKNLDKGKISSNQHTRMHPRDRGGDNKRGHVGYSGRSNAYPIGFSERDDTENRKEVIC